MGVISMSREYLKAFFGRFVSEFFVMQSKNSQTVCLPQEFLMQHGEKSDTKMLKGGF